MTLAQEYAARCWSYTYHGASMGTFAGQCFGIIAPRWSPTPDVADVVSAKVSWPYAAARLKPSSSRSLIWRLTCSCPASEHRCRSDDDCSLNGKCTASKQCKCRPQWSGDRCETLRLGAATRGAGYRAVDDGHNTSSWGGAVLLDETTGTYHMYASEMTAHCGIGAWAQNSRVVHATSATPGGTYERKGVVWGVFSHEPMMARAPTKHARERPTKSGRSI